MDIAATIDCPSCVEWVAGVMAEGGAAGGPVIRDCSDCGRSLIVIDTRGLDEPAVAA